MCYWMLDVLEITAVIKFKSAKTSLTDDELLVNSFVDI